MSEIYSDNLSLGLEKCYIWQYDHGERFKEILEKELEFYKVNVQDFWKNFYTNIFNIDTANDFGLSIWGATLGIPRPSYDNDGEIVPFNTEQYRALLKGTILLMNSTASVHDINNFLQAIFPNKPVFVRDTHNQTMILSFFYDPDDEEMALINFDGFFPRPAGVNKKIDIYTPSETFGFNGSGLQSFDNGTFWV